MSHINFIHPLTRSQSHGNVQGRMGSTQPLREQLYTQLRVGGSLPKRKNERIDIKRKLSISSNRAANP